MYVIRSMMTVMKSMEFPMVLLRLSHWFLYNFVANSCSRIKNHGVFSLRNPPWIKSSSSSSQQCPYPSLTNSNLQDLKARPPTALVCDLHGGLLRSRTFFPYFMLVAFEGGSMLRALLLLLSCPLLWILHFHLQLRIMIFISFCGLRVKDMDSVARAVLPKFYLENINLFAYEALESAQHKVVVTNLPRVMVEGFLKEYLGVHLVLGTDLHTVGGFFTGFLSESGLLVKHRAVKELFGDKKPDVGISTCSLLDHLFLSLCKEGFVITKEEMKSIPAMPRDRYPKPLIFHDGRLAFFPTPAAVLAMFIWIPIGVILAIFRLLVGICLPYKVAIPIGTASGVELKLQGCAPARSQTGKGVLYVCTHRTLLDPVFLSTALNKPLTAVTYSLSKMSEIIAPIRTVRLSRDRSQDAVTMQRLLREGDLVVCPEGTTCREPYLLRFSSLFAELADEIVPVAMEASVSMFYGTTASGLKWLDPIFFLMNPRPRYSVRVLEKVPRELTCAGGRSSIEVANHIQRQLGMALGFECTNFTRRDKYLMLAGNDGTVGSRKTKIRTKSKP
ncbi:glycerol-3-phosphate acyltransferase 1 [Andrographis paniculata]|uniref:glycerol-3-phosphate acyltransferase 1 n=1 Tax=Andrographis paniculata TaxID=175694 RepID=UPI0021E845C0|nr:glycerol-3-phosphate acyltransferase 1 [Andrographis paniculata]